MNFSEVFKDILAERNLGIQELSKSTNIDDSILYDYLHGTIPAIEFAVRLANFLNCSLNYLFGIDDIPDKIKFKQDFDLSKFISRYQEILLKNNITHYQVSKKSKLNYSSYDVWCKGGSPSLKSVYIIANYFDVSIDYLIGRSEEQ